MRRILLTEALGQIESNLIPALGERHGADQVVASDIRVRSAADYPPDGPFEHLDCITTSPQVPACAAVHDR